MSGRLEIVTGQGAKFRTALTDAEQSAAVMVGPASDRLHKLLAEVDEIVASLRGEGVTVEITFPFGTGGRSAFASTRFAFSIQRGIGRAA